MAVKVLRDSLLTDASVRKRFVREGKILAGVRSVNLVRLYSVNVSNRGLAEEIPKLGFLQCRTCHFRNELEARYQLARKQQVAATRLQATGTQSPGRQLKAIAGEQSKNVNAGKLKPLVSTESADMKLKPVEASQIMQMLAPFPATMSQATQMTKLGENHYSLSRGSMLMKVEAPLRIDTPHATVFAKPGSIIMLTTTGMLTRVADMVDTRKDGVIVKLDQYEHSLLPGKEVTISSLRHHPMNALLSDDLARRRIKETEVGGLKVIGADFSIMDALIKHPLLKAVRTSDRDIDRDMLKRIEKTAAIVSVLIDRQAGPYYEPKVEPNSGIASSPVERIY